MGVGLLEELVGPDTIAALERRGLVNTDAGGRRFEARVAHPVYGEVLRSQASPIRSRRIRAALAEALTRHGLRRKGDVLKVAALRVDADGSADPVLLTRASALAWGLLDMGLSERLGRAAVAAGAGLDAPLIVSTAMSFDGRPEEADQELAHMTAYAESDDDRARIAIARVANLFWSLRRPEESEGVLREAESTSDPATSASLELRGLRAALAYHLGRPREAVDVAEHVLASPEASDVAQAWAAAAGTCAWARMGAPLLAAEVSRLGTEAVQRAPQATFLEGALAWGDFTGDLLAGELHDAAEKAARCQARSIQALPSGASPIGALVVGMVALSRGTVRTAWRWFREVLATMAGQDAASWGWLGHIYATQALGMAGDANGARRALDETAAARHPSLVIYEVDHVLAQAWVAAAEGVSSQACDRARAAAALAAAQGIAAMEVHAWHTLVRLGGRSEAAEAAPRLRELTDVVQGPMAPTAAGHARAASELDGQELDRVGMAFDAMGAALLAVDAFAQAAAAHRVVGRRSDAIGSGRRACDLATRCEGARTPAVAGLELPLPISDREREVVLLAARGMSNREIAQRLVVSIRTVESHLYQASAKLGVTGRAGLAELLDLPADGPTL